MSWSQSPDTTGSCHPPSIAARATVQSVRDVPGTKYTEAMTAVQLVWEAFAFAFAYACAERLRPVPVDTAEIPAHHGEVFLTPLTREHRACASHSRLARRISSWTLEPAGRATPGPKPSSKHQA